MSLIHRILQWCVALTLGVGLMAVGTSSVVAAAGHTPTQGVTDVFCPGPGSSEGLDALPSNYVTLADPAPLSTVTVPLYDVLLVILGPSASQEIGSWPWERVVNTHSKVLASVPGPWTRCPGPQVTTLPTKRYAYKARSIGTSELMAKLTKQCLADRACRTLPALDLRVTVK
jgi:hypothetical protein